MQSDQKFAEIFDFKTLFFYKTCNNRKVSLDMNLQQVLRMKKKRFLKSFTYKIYCKT